jgi:stage V sporulation protein SpoVS
MESQQTDNVLKIRGDKDFQQGNKDGKTYIRKLASAILTVLDKYDEVKLKAVGAPSVNNAVKAFIVAKSMMKDKKYELVCTADFDTADFNGNQKTAIMFKIFAEEVDGPQNT